MIRLSREHLNRWAKSLIKTNPFHRRILGISKEEEGLKVAYVTKHKGKITVDSCECMAFSAKENVRLRDEHTELVTGLESHEVVVRSLCLPLKAKRKIFAALPFQLEALLPFSSDQAITCPFLKAVDQKSTRISLIATSKERLKEHLNAFASWDISPDIVTCAQIALLRFAQWLYPQQKELLLFHCTKQRIQCILIQEGELVLSQSIKSDASSELERLSVFLKEKAHLVDNTPWILLGESSLNALWIQTFGDCRLPLPLVLAEEKLHSHCLAIGFALDALFSDARSVQLRQEEFTPPHHLRLRKKRALLYATSCLIFTAILGISTMLIAHKKTKALSDKLLFYFPSNEKQHILSISEIEDSLLKSEQFLKKHQKNAFPFFLTVPKVSDVLSWLSTHPSFVTAEGGPKEGIDIKSMRYQLLKFPTLDDPSLPYQAQVEIEFTATTPRLAREFHEALLKGDCIVNAKKEIKWQPQGTLYSIQFQLNKSPPL